MSRPTMFTDAPEKVIYDYLMDDDHSRKEKEKFLDRLKNQNKGHALLQDTLALAKAEHEKMEPIVTQRSATHTVVRTHPNREKVEWVIKSITTELKFASVEARLIGVELSLHQPR